MYILTCNSTEISNGIIIVKVDLPNKFVCHIFHILTVVVLEVKYAFTFLICSFTNTILYFFRGYMTAIQVNNENTPLQ